MHAESLTEIPNRPVTAMVIGGAILVSVTTLQGQSFDGLLMGPEAFVDEPWRLVTSIFPHGDGIHLLFNVIWTWIFGTYFEREFGPLQLLGFVVFMAAVSMAAQYAVTMGGIGLSGVGYGLFGFLWATSRYDRRRRDAVDDSTVQLFIVWGVLCIVLTAADILPVGNEAHGAGLAFGYGLGALRAVGPGARAAVAAALVAGTALVFLGATVARRWVAFRDPGAIPFCDAGWRKLDKKQPDKALVYLSEAMKYPRVSAGCRHNYGVALYRDGQFDEAQRYLLPDDGPTGDRSAQ